jgi:hypothetical protein
MDRTPGGPVRGGGEDKDRWMEDKMGQRKSEREEREINRREEEWKIKKIRLEARGGESTKE